MEQAAITMQEAEAFIREFISCREKLNPQEIFVNPEDIKAKNYYSSKLISFIFKKEYIDRLFEGQDADALRIYYAAHDNGDPTLVLVACKLNNYGTGATNKTRAAEQHPKPPTLGFTGDKMNFNIQGDNTP